MSVPRPLGWYRPAVRAGNLVFVSGQLPVDERGKIILASPQEQARRALSNLQATLKAAGAELSQVVKLTIFLKDMRMMSEIDDVYKEFFTSDPPARSTVGVANLPKDSPLEIEAIALIREAPKAG